MSYSTVLHAVGWLLLLLATAVLLPWATAMFNGESASIVAFSLTLLLAGFSGGALIMAFRDVRKRPSKYDLLTLVVVGWIAIPLFAAVPFYVSGFFDNTTDAYFEAVSGFTTTGASVIPTLDIVDRSIIIWRAVLQWFGGWASIVMGAAVLAPLGVGGMELRVSPLTRADKARALDRFRGTAEAVGGIYAAFTAAAFLLIWAGGIPPFDAFCLALSAVSTGGFLPSDTGLADYRAPWAMAFLFIFMGLGAISFATHRAGLRGRGAEYKEDPEVMYLGLAVVAAGTLFAFMALGETGDVIAAIGNGLFLAMSLVTGTGYMSPDPSLNAGLSSVFVIGLILLGGATLSTAGGIKLMRFALLMKQSSRELKRLVHPHGIIRTHFGRRSVSIQIMKSVWSFFVLFLVAYAVLAAALAASGLGFEAALVASASALGNAGPAYDLVHPLMHGESPLYPDMYVSHAAAAVHIEDRGFQFADSVYEVCAVQDGRLIDERWHFERLERSLQQLDVEVPVTSNVLAVIYREVLRKNRLRNAIVYCQVTRGVAPRDHAFPIEPVPATVVVTAKRIDGDALEKRRSNGISVVTRPDERWARCDIKSTGLLANVLAKQSARSDGAFEAWLVDSDDHITEGTSTNAWIVTRKGVLVTRQLDHHILGGITRRALLECAKDLGIVAEERAFSRTEALDAVEAFSSASTVGALPVISIDQVQISDGKPGPMTQKLNGLYRDRSGNLPLT
eukprot:s1_g1842.t1